MAAVCVTEIFELICHPRYFPDLTAITNIIRFRTWSVPSNPSHIPLPPLYLRRVAPEAALNRRLCQLLWLKYCGHDPTGFYYGKWIRLSIHWTWHGSQEELHQIWLSIQWTWHGSQGELHQIWKTKIEDIEVANPVLRLSYFLSLLVFGLNLVLCFKTRTSNFLGAAFLFYFVSSCLSRIYSLKVLVYCPILKCEFTKETMQLSERIDITFSAVSYL